MQKRRHRFGSSCKIAHTERARHPKHNYIFLAGLGSFNCIIKLFLGTPLSDIDVEWMQDEPDNHNNEEDCLIMYSSGRLADVKCANTYPFICYKQSQMMNAHKCSYTQTGITSSGKFKHNSVIW